MLNQRLQQKLLQKLSPQQILLMKLLQIPTVGLEQRIKQEIEDNQPSKLMPIVLKPIAISARRWQKPVI